ncbi:unnamed protein product [Didymodactylos carnosus]|uniref:Uncharacterized protein n=1 Tax=Didymodactylos carnosus TaxID=1234261 RepID=A0A814JXM4_9BILA|nr:unnamed protein product [Didymodactylos carnosus]CAF3813435.1 unnamed protein product [Didymodactylos carnosus]
MRSLQHDDEYVKYLQTLDLKAHENEFFTKNVENLRALFLDVYRNQISKSIVRVYAQYKTKQGLLTACSNICVQDLFISDIKFEYDSLLMNAKELKHVSTQPGSVKVDAVYYNDEETWSYGYDLSILDTGKIINKHLTKEMVLSLLCDSEETANKSHQIGVLGYPGVPESYHHLQYHLYQQNIPGAISGKIGHLLAISKLFFNFEKLVLSAGVVYGQAGSSPRLYPGLYDSLKGMSGGIVVDSTGLIIGTHVSASRDGFNNLITPAWNTAYKELIENT